MHRSLIFRAQQGCFHLLQAGRAHIHYPMPGPAEWAWGLWLGREILDTVEWAAQVGGEGHRHPHLVSLRLFVEWGDSTWCHFPGVGLRPPPGFGTSCGPLPSSGGLCSTGWTGLSRCPASWDMNLALERGLADSRSCWEQRIWPPLQPYMDSAPAWSHPVGGGVAGFCSLRRQAAL